MAMSRPQLLASRALWRNRELYRYSKWRHYVRVRKSGDPLRAKWFGLYTEARANRQHRDRQLAALTVTHVDQAGLEFLRAREGDILRPYNDSQDNATIGVGHLIHRGPVTAADRAHWGSLTEAESLGLLAHDLYRFEAAVAKAFAGAPIKATQNEFNAAVSLAFNIGAAGFAGSTVAREIHAGNRQAAADAFLAWDHPPELLGRRRLERALFLKEN